MHELMLELYTKKEVYHYFNELQLKELLMSNLQRTAKKICIERSRELLSKKENTKVYFILSGIVAVKRDGNLLYFRGENHFIGLETILFSEKSEFVTSNIGRVELIEFSKVEVLELLMGLQEGWLYCYLINKDLNQLLMRNYSNFQAKPYERCKQMLTDLAKEFGSSSEPSAVLPKQFTLNLLTNYLGISYVTMRKVLEILRDENFIVESGRRKEIRIQTD